MDTLSKIFGSNVRVKVLRLFLLNPEKVYQTSEIVKSLKSRKKEVENEINAFNSAGLIKLKKISEAKSEGKLFSGWTINNSFVHLSLLRELVTNGVMLKKKDVLGRLSRSGTLKLVVLSGVFIKQWDSRLDVLIVGDRLNKSSLIRNVHAMESEIGRDLKYAVLETADFQYRQSIGDRLVRDVFDYPHSIILNRLGVGKSPIRA